MIKADFIPWNKGKIFSGPKICKVDGCGKSAHYKQWGKGGFCANHAAMLKRNGKPERVHGSPGSGCISRGYKFIRVAGKQVPEHRHIMEKHLGRKLKPFPEEIIHHANGNGTDNKIENLILTSQSDHMYVYEYKRHRNATEKTCTICLKVKSRTEFYTSKLRRDGHQARCKSCQKQYNKDHPRKNKS